MEISNNQFLLKERAPGVSIKEIINATEGKVVVPDHVPEMILN